MAGWLDIQCGSGAPTAVADDSAATAAPVAGAAAPAEEVAAPAEEVAAPAAEAAPAVSAIDKDLTDDGDAAEAAPAADATVAVSTGTADSCLYFPSKCSGATVRSGPGNSFQRIMRMPQGTNYVIDCQTTGQPIRNSLAESSNTWNRVTLEDGRGGWISDTWGGNVGWLDNQC